MNNPKIPNEDDIRNWIKNNYEYEPIGTDEFSREWAAKWLAEKTEEYYQHKKSDGQTQSTNPKM